MFNWLKTLTRSILENPSIPLNSAAALELFNSSPSSSGIRLTKHSAFGLPALWRGIDLIASTCARVDCLVYRHTTKNGKEEDWEHPAYPLLKKRSNSYQSAFTFKQQLVSDAIWSGNGYAYIQRDDMGNPIELHLLNPDHTYPVIVRSSKTMDIVQFSYCTTINNITQTLPYTDIIHIKGLSTDQGLLGMRLIDVAREVLGWGLATIKYSGYWFENAGMPGLVIQIPGSMPREKMEEWRENLAVTHNGLRHSHKPMLLTNGATLASNRLPTAEESALIESRNLTSVDVSNLLGLPPSKFGVAGSVAYNSLEQENLSILNDCYDKWFTNLEQEFEIKLLSEFDKRTERRFIRFDRNKLVGADVASYSTMLTSLRNNGAISTNELRHRLDLNRIDEDWADEFFQASNLTPLDVADTDPADPDDTSSMKPPAPVTDQAGAQLWQDEALRSLARKTLGRLFTRVRKSCNENKLNAFEMSNHFPIFLDSLDSFTRAAEIMEPVLANLEQEIRAVTPDQLEAVFSRIDTERIVNELCKK